MAGRVDVGAVRRAQIVEAATRVIARKGFHNATLAEVESEARISRGMMTYHFPTKDAMILAVFDSLIERLRGETFGSSPADALTGRARIDHWIGTVVERSSGDEIPSLLYAFLAQMAHREDYRERLASFYAGLRDDLASDLRAAHCLGDPHDLAALLVAMVHGLAVQLAADPHGLEARPLAATFRSLVDSVFPRDEIAR